MQVDSWNKKWVRKRPRNNILRLMQKWSFGKGLNERKGNSDINLIGE
jgi:hypothetical protein